MSRVKMKLIRLHSFIMSDECGKWIKRTHHQVPFVQEEFKDFQMEDYIATCLEVDYHFFVQSLCHTAMFEEYFRNRLKSLGIHVVSTFGKQNTGFKLRRRKWQKQSNNQSLTNNETISENSSSNPQNRSVTRRITFPRRIDASDPTIAANKESKNERRRVSTPK